MRPPKINDHKLLRLIDNQGMNQTKAAKELGGIIEAADNHSICQ